MAATGTVERDGAGTGPVGLGAHLVWEALLAVVVAVVVLVGLAGGPGSLRTTFVPLAGIAGLAACAMALSLLLRAPNLAVGAVAQFSGIAVAQLTARAGWSYPLAIVATLVAVTVSGALAGLLAGALRLPAWAVSLGMGWMLLAVVVNSFGYGVTQVSFAPSPWLWFVLFLAVSMALAGLGRLPAVRGRAASGGPVPAPGAPGRPAEWTAPPDPADGPGGIGRTVLALAGSNLLAALAGLAELARLRSVSAGIDDVLLVALAAALVGGVGVGGRRIGLFGLPLGAMLVTGLRILILNRNLPVWLPVFLSGALVLTGLIVGWILGRVGSRAPAVGYRPAGPEPWPAPGPAAAAPPPGQPGFPPPGAWPGQPGFAPAAPDPGVTTVLPPGPPPGLGQP